jgi:hypothetical protein
MLQTAVLSFRLLDRHTHRFPKWAKPSFLLAFPHFSLDKLHPTCEHGNKVFAAAEPSPSQESSSNQASLEAEFEENPAAKRSSL